MESGPADLAPRARTLVVPGLDQPGMGGITSRSLGKI